ncbi:hypothetical protein Peur_028191 [Populus x canadensis]
MLADEEIMDQFPIHSWSFFNPKDTPLLDKRDEKPSFRCIFRNLIFKKQANGFDAYESITYSDYSLPSRMKQRSIPVHLVQ